LSFHLRITGHHFPLGPLRHRSALLARVRRLLHPLAMLLGRSGLDIAARMADALAACRFNDFESEFGMACSLSLRHLRQRKDQHAVAIARIGEGPINGLRQNDLAVIWADRPSSELRHHLAFIEPKEALLVRTDLKGYVLGGRSKGGNGPK
jgi:hypothetical protein